ncbi:M24 family metallopeptidase [Burkholderia alba]|uniref:M24 family metallopeptidase n=1 Tax=Burkholderia alba TaxID=2683677 RepID=UPI002B05640B|nr:M24 family metallopeptidase [Burkholderia alba]
MDGIESKERVGAHYHLPAMEHAQAMTWRAVEQLAVRIEPGMTEGDAREAGRALLAELDMQRIWHPLIVRFGANTLKPFKAQSDGDPVLGSDDIFFIDMGIVWNGHEGDAGATFTTGGDPEMAACAAAAKTLYDDVSARWRQRDLTGQQLYEYAAAQATQMGWDLNLGIKGHRVSDFPHAIYRAGNLGDLGGLPGAGLWILEIQIAHPHRPFGAFYEDLLV